MFVLFKQIAERASRKREAGGPVSQGCPSKVALSRQFALHRTKQHSQVGLFIFLFYVHVMTLITSGGTDWINLMKIYRIGH